MEQEYQCACCGETNTVEIDTEAGDYVQLVEDCRVCCRPNVITCRYNSYRDAYDITVYQEDVG